MEITDYSVAKKVIESALAEGFVEEDDVPEEEDEFIEKAQSLYEMAIDARDNHDVDTDDVLGIIKIAETKPKGGKAASKGKSKAKAKPEPDPEPEEDEDEDEEEAEESGEPWEDYDKDKIADIVAAIEIWGEDGDLDSIKQLLAYEESDKNRKKIVAAAESFLADDESDEDEDEDAEEPDEAEEDEDAEEESDEVEGDAAEEPYEGYDDSSVKEIKEAMTEFVAEDDGEDDEALLETLNAVIAYEEAAEKPRVSIVKHVTKLVEQVQEAEDGDEEEPEAEEEGEEEPEEAAAPAAKSARKGGRKGGKASSEADGYSANVGTEGLGAGEDPEYDDLIDFVIDELAAESLHVPDTIEEDVIDLPFDLSETSEAGLASLHSAFGAYRYRASYLLTKHETIQVKSRQAADEIVDAILADSDDGVTLAFAKARAEQHPEVKKWRLRQRHHNLLAEAMRRRRDDYEAVCALLSRQITARDDQWRHAGGASTEDAPKKTVKKSPMASRRK